MKKLFSAALLVIMALFLPLSAYAANANTDKPMSPRFSYILSMSAGLEINSAGKAVCGGTVTPSSNTYTSDLTVSLQQKTGTGWSTIKSWTDSGEGYLGVNLEGHWYVVHGTYRVCSTAKIYSSSGTLLETQLFYSAERIY